MADVKRYIVLNNAARLASLSSKELLTYDGYASEWKQKHGKSTRLVGKTDNDERKEETGRWS